MNIATSILLYTFISSSIILISYYVLLFTKVKNNTPANTTTPTPPISVVIVAKNEAANLKRNIPLIMDQDYPQFEVIVVNDSSNDGTEDLLYELRSQYSNLETTNILESQKTFPGKKLPITLGAKKAKYNNLVFTDADCYPNSDNWLTEMGTNYDKDIIIAYSPYEKRKGLLNKLIRYDTTQIGIQYLSHALTGRPYMGVGRNLAYKKDFFFEVGGFRSQYHISSGDDDLFINKNIHKDNYRVMTSPDSFIISYPKENWNSWWKQKRRHLSTSYHYKLASKITLGLYHLSQTLFYLSLALLLINRIQLITVGIIFLIKTIIQLLVSSTAYKRLKATDLLALSVIYEPLLLLIQILVTISLRFSKSIKWK